MMNKKLIKEGLKEFNQIEVDNYIEYIEKLQTEKDKEGKLKNTWSTYKKDEELILMFKKVANQGLVFDGKHIILQNVGVSYSYIAYKNLMLIKYPETLIDIQLVYQGDEIEFGKVSGKISYNHKISNPFERKENEVIGGYCVIKNKRGEFLTTLNIEELLKHRKIAKTDYIWANWTNEMYSKTLIKKAIKIHFDDIYTEILEEDNKENDLDNPLDLELTWKKEIDSIKNTEELKIYWEKNKGKGVSFSKYVTKRKRELEKETKIRKRN